MDLRLPRHVGMRKNKKVTYAIFPRLIQSSHSFKRIHEKREVAFPK